MKTAGRILVMIIAAVCSILAMRGILRLLHYRWRRRWHCRGLIDGERAL
ncbi:MAG: hypothetical protein FWH00_04070 [Oscillospiraceae bacterium]|nr:hypothetical protein [Oscillospiraceae bacterium]